MKYNKYPELNEFSCLDGLTGTDLMELYQGLEISQTRPTTKKNIVLASLVISLFETNQVVKSQAFIAEYLTETIGGVRTVDTIATQEAITTAQYLLELQDWNFYYNRSIYAYVRNDYGDVATSVSGRWRGTLRPVNGRITVEGKKLRHKATSAASYQASRRAAMESLKAAAQHSSYVNAIPATQSVRDSERAQLQALQQRAMETLRHEVGKYVK